MNSFAGPFTDDFAKCLVTKTTAVVLVTKHLAKSSVNGPANEFKLKEIKIIKRYDMSFFNISSYRVLRDMFS